MNIQLRRIEKDCPECYAQYVFEYEGGEIFLTKLPTKEWETKDMVKGGEVMKEEKFATLTEGSSKYDSMRQEKEANVSLFTNDP